MGEAVPGIAFLAGVGQGGGVLSEVTEKTKVGAWQDLQVLMKVRLNVFVLVTTFFGFLLGSRGGEFDWWLMVNVLVGTAACAFGSAVFNQVMEVEDDARMVRTADRPLPSRRMSVLAAFLIGWGLAGFGVIHLWAKVNPAAAVLAAVTIGTYVFIYTPMKKWTSLNTLVGAVPGAIPPMIGWAGAGQPWNSEAGWFLFSLLFLWQLPHFVAISWLCREDYEGAGYEMWSNGDVSGRKSGRVAVFFSGLLGLLAFWVLGLDEVGDFGWVAVLVGVGFGVWMGWRAWEFSRSGERGEMRRVFFLTLIYLPVMLGVLAVVWR